MIARDHNIAESPVAAKRAGTTLRYQGSGCLKWSRGLHGTVKQRRRDDERRAGTDEKCDRSHNWHAGSVEEIVGDTSGDIDLGR